jgi:phosphoribosylamine--glycine ligase
MGAYSPAADVLDDVALKRVSNRILEPVLEGLKRDGIEYRGCLYAGLIVTARGPMVLEFNARFGDPETQVVLPRLESDFFELLAAAARGQLGEIAAPVFSNSACTGVVLTSDGYPQVSRALTDLPPFTPLENESTVGFWGGSTIAGERVNVTGGRVLTISAVAGDMVSARKRAYEAVAEYEKLLPQGVVLRYRSDIAARFVAAIR